MTVFCIPSFFFRTINFATFIFTGVLWSPPKLIRAALDIDDTLYAPLLIPLSTAEQVFNLLKSISVNGKQEAFFWLAFSMLSLFSADQSGAIGVYLGSPLLLCAYLIDPLLFTQVTPDSGAQHLCVGILLQTDLL